MTIPEAKRITRMNEWKQLIHERQQSGQSVRVWCLQNGIRENSYYYWLRIIREEALCEAENKSGALVRIEPEKLAVETVSPQSSSGGIVIRANGVEAEFPSGGYTDMRKQIDGLAALVQIQFGQEMEETSLYLFCGRRADRIKALYWDGTGYMEKRFQWPRNEKELKKLTQQEFRWLMEGLSITQTKAFIPGKPGTVC